jgi:hypothetical protein
MDPELEDLCTTRLFYEKFRGTDPRTGARLYDDPPSLIPVHGKVEPFVRIVTDAEKRSVQSNTRVFLPAQDDLGGDVSISEHDRLTLPSAVHPVISVQREDDPETGEAYAWVVYL